MRSSEEYQESLQLLLEFADRKEFGNKINNLKKATIKGFKMSKINLPNDGTQTIKSNITFNEFVDLFKTLTEGEDKYFSKNIFDKPEEYQDKYIDTFFNKIEKIVFNKSIKKLVVTKKDIDIVLESLNTMVRTGGFLDSDVGVSMIKNLPENTGPERYAKKIAARNQRIFIELSKISSDIINQLNNNAYRESADENSYKFPQPTRNNLNKEEAEKCKHQWSYGGGSMWCRNCGWFQQPDGRITKTPSGKSGEFLESAFIDVSDYFDEGTKINTIMDKIKIIWNKFINLILSKLHKLEKKVFKNTKDKYDIKSILTISEMVNVCEALAPTGDILASTRKLDKLKIMLNRETTMNISVGIKDINKLSNEIDRLSKVDEHVDGRMQANMFNDANMRLWGQWRSMVAKITNIISKFIGEFNSIENKSEYKKESANPEYNTDMNEAQAKKTLRTLSQTLMNDLGKDGKKMSQYTANIYANIITKNLLPKWANGFSRVKITLDSYQSLPVFEFITPAMSQDFVGRFINGRENMHGFLHRSPEIRIKMSPKVFHNMKNPDDAYNFFKAAIKYYDSQVEKYAVKVVAETMKLGHNMKHLIANTKLSGLVTYPLTMLFVFDDVDMANRDIFKISNEDIQTINRFVKNISSKYAAPEKEKKQIVDDVKKMVEALREACEPNETTSSLSYLPEAVEQLYSNGFTNMILESSRLFIEEQIDRTPPATKDLKYLREAWGVKKLKKIPKDLIPYIQIETEAIKDANDKMILSSYTLGKIEIVEWYIELLTVGSKKYIVPHTKPYLEIIRTQLLQCFKKIMNTSVVKNDKAIDIKYPPGYEG